MPGRVKGYVYLLRLYGNFTDLNSGTVEDYVSCLHQTADFGGDQSIIILEPHAGYSVLVPSLITPSPITARCRYAQHGDGVCCAFAPQMFLITAARPAYAGTEGCYRLLVFFRPPGTVVPDGLMFYP